MTRTGYSIDRVLERYPNALDTINRIVTGDAYFQIFQKLSDNYSPTLTVTRVQGPQVEQMMAQGAGDSDRIVVDRNARRSGSITVKVGQGRPTIWLSAHADVCSYLTGPWDGTGYSLTPFCMHRSSAGKRAAAAMDLPRGDGPLTRLASGYMVTDTANKVRFECDRDDLPMYTRVVHDLPAAWDHATDQVTGFLDNQAGSAAMLLAAQALSHFDANALLLVNDEEEGPVDMGNQGFSRAANRLLHRTPLDELPNYVVVSDGHGQESELASGKPTNFGAGASFTGMSSGARGGITPPQILGFTRDLAAWLQPHGIKLHEHKGYVGRSDDISAMQFTQNVSIIGYPNAYSHFEKPPISHMSDLVNLTRTLVMLTLITQDEDWQRVYL